MRSIALEVFVLTAIVAVGLFVYVKLANSSWFGKKVETLAPPENTVEDVIADLNEADARAERVEAETRASLAAAEAAQKKLAAKRGRK